MRYKRLNFGGIASLDGAEEAQEMQDLSTHQGWAKKQRGNLVNTVEVTGDNWKYTSGTEDGGGNEIREDPEVKEGKELWECTNPGSVGNRGGENP